MLQETEILQTIVGSDFGSARTEAEYLVSFKQRMENCHTYQKVAERRNLYYPMADVPDNDLEKIFLFNELYGQREIREYVAQHGPLPEVTHLYDSEPAWMKGFNATKYFSLFGIIAFLCWLDDSPWRVILGFTGTGLVFATAMTFMRQKARNKALFNEAVQIASRYLESLFYYQHEDEYKVLFQRTRELALSIADLCLLIQRDILIALKGEASLSVS